METNNLNSISRIHEDGGLYGILIESGCAGIVNHRLQMVAGASKTVYMAESPYSKEYQHETYRNLDVRSIGKETAVIFAKKWIREYLTDMHKGVTFIYTSTFQIGDENNSIATHGWITFTDLTTMTMRVFHISLHEPQVREGYINVIGELGCSIIGSRGGVPRYTDYVEDFKINKSGFGTYALEKQPCASHLLLEALDQYRMEKYPICISGEKMVRPEDLFRDKPYIIAYKGSFNPVHNSHLEYAQLVEKMYGVKPTFSLSLDVFEKGHLDAKEIIKRAKNINKLGYDVVIMKSGYFGDFVSGMRKFNKPIVFPVGVDTFNRIITSTHTTPEHFQASFGDNNTKFVVLEREGYTLAPDHTNFKEHIDHIVAIENKGLSSTHIRQLKSENKLEEIKALVPEQVYNQIKDE